MLNHFFKRTSKKDLILLILLLHKTICFNRLFYQQYFVHSACGRNIANIYVSLFISYDYHQTITVCNKILSFINSRALILEMQCLQNFRDVQRDRHIHFLKMVKLCSGLKTCKFIENRISKIFTNPILYFFVYRRK